MGAAFVLDLDRYFLTSLHELIIALFSN